MIGPVWTLERKYDNQLFKVCKTHDIDVISYPYAGRRNVSTNEGYMHYIYMLYYDI